MDKFTSKGISVCLLVMAFVAPLSIAGTQTAWAVGLLFWIIRAVAVRPRPQFEKLDLAILGFVGLTLISSFFSYEPEISLRKMVSVSLVTIVYLVATNLKDKRTLHRILVLLLVGGFLACTWAFVRQAVGKNLKVLKLTAESPLRAAGVEENDTIIAANKRLVSKPEHVFRLIQDESPNGIASVTIYRHELINTYKFPASSVTSVESLGILEYQRGRDTRAQGFYGHYVTFAEMLQLVGSLTLALLIVAPGGLFTRERVLLGVVLLATVGALFLTITRASWASFMLSATIITLVAASKRTVLITAGIAILLAIGGLGFLQLKRNVSFFDSKDDSTTWRTMVWKEGFDVLTMNPRHMIVGIGMDSLTRRWRDWHMFDDGRQPIGHMHSNFLQIALERGIPALVAWLAWMALYLHLLWKNVRRRDLAWPARGLLVGAFGGTIGFLTSGFVHYNWGDSEVVMIFYLIMGLSLSVIRVSPNDADNSLANA